MSLFSREPTTPTDGHPANIFTGSSFSIAAAPHGLYLAAIVGIILIMAAGSILAIQMRPYVAPPGSTLGEHTNQPRLADAERMPIEGKIVMQGGDDHDRII